MSKWEDVMKGLVDRVGADGLKSLDAALGDLEKETKVPWKKALLNLTADAVDRYGLDGVKRVEDLVDRLGKGQAPNLKFASLRARSDYLAALQNMEAEDRTRAKLFYSKVGKALSVILKSILSGLLG